MLGTKTSRLLLVAAVLAGLCLPATASARRSLCGRDDLPEAGIQGDVPLADQLSGRATLGYNCGIAVVGYNDLGGDRANANMAWAGDCAYVASVGGIAVVDVSDPAHPVHVSTLNGPGSTLTIETLHAVVAPDRALLVAGRYGLLPVSDAAPVDIYDVSDCAHPRLLTTFGFPGNVHNLTLTADARRLYSTLPLQAADLTDPSHPVYLGNLEDGIRAAGGSGLQYAHEAWPTPDGRLLYIGSQVTGDERFMVLDISKWPASPPEIRSQFVAPGHSIRPATIKGRQYLLQSDESVVDPTAKGCVPDLTPVGGPSQPYLTDVTDPGSPRTVSQFRLAINEPDNCAEEVASGVNASVHYHDLDDPDHTTFAMLSMWNAGLRVVDVRNPLRPTEVAYFNPGQFAVAGGGRMLDTAWGHVRYVPATGHIWLATRTGGFWVLELEPRVRRALGLPPVAAVHPNGAPARPVASLGPVEAPPPLAAPGAYYCTLNLAA